MFLDLSNSRNHGHPLRDLQAPDLPNTAGCPRLLWKEGPEEGAGLGRGGQLPVGGALGRCWIGLPSDWSTHLSQLS